MDIVEEEGMFGGTTKWYCDCVGWNSKGIGVKVLAFQ